MNPAQRSSRIEALFPPGVVAAEFAGAASPDQLLPGEVAGVGRMAASRAAEFTAGRLCARQALAALGMEGCAITSAPDRKPVWPDGIVGSITHTDGMCAAVVARQDRFLGLGLDTEIVGRVTEALAARVCVSSEVEWIATLPVNQQSAARTLVFAAKEAFYKAQSPLTGEWLGFDALVVQTLGLQEAVEVGAVADFTATATRRIRLDREGPQPWRGRFRLYGEFLSAGLALSKPGRPGIP